MYSDTLIQSIFKEQDLSEVRKYANRYGSVPGCGELYGIHKYLIDCLNSDQDSISIFNLNSETEELLKPKWTTKREFLKALSRYIRDIYLETKQ